MEKLEFKIYNGYTQLDKYSDRNLLFRNFLVLYI